MVLGSKLVNPDRQIDCTGLFCPMPIVMTREAIAQMGVGELLEMRSDDPASEAHHPAIKGVAVRERAGATRVVLSAVEHISVINTCRDLEKSGAILCALPVDGDGRVDPGMLRAVLTPDTTLVSIAAANPEIGTLQPLKEIGRITREAGVPLHVDGVGALGRVPLNVEAMGIDLLTISGNDLYGPPGSGALWVRPGVRVHPQVLGGGQEGGYRSGTENVPGMVGFGVAAELMRVEGAHQEAARLAALRDRLLSGLLEAIPDCRLTGSRGARLPHHLE